MFCTRVAWVCLLLCNEEGSSPVSTITEKRDMGLYEDYVSQLPYVWYYVGVKSNFQHARESERAYVFRCLMFSLSGPCELLCLLLFYCLMDLSCGEYDVIYLYFMCCSVNGYVCLVCCGFVNCLVN